MNRLNPLCDLKPLCLLILNFLIWGNWHTLYGQIVDRNPYVFLTRTNGLISEVEPLPQKTRGPELFWEDEWYLGDVKSFNHEFIINKPLRYNISQNRLEVQINQKTMGLSYNYVKSFEWFNVTDNRRAIFVNCKKLTFAGFQPSGFLEILSDGSLTLSRHKTLEKNRKSRKSAIAERQRKKDAYIIEQLYYSKNGGLIIQLPTRKKDIFEIFQDKKETIRRFISWNGLDLKQQEDLVKVFDFYNLVAGG